MFAFSARSIERLQQVHPDLARCAHRAISLTTNDFGITCGLRCTEEQAHLFKTGKSEILKSLHLKQPTGYAHAIDILAYKKNNATWENRFYGPIIQAFITAAIDLKIQLQFGHLWETFAKGNRPDSVHIQLNSHYYESNL